jgi:hypothetical protein
VRLIPAQAIPDWPFLQTSNKTEINAENIRFGWLHVENQNNSLPLLTLPFSVYIASRCVKTNVHSWPCDTSGCTTNYYPVLLPYFFRVYIQCANDKEGRQVQVVICDLWTRTGKKDEVAGHSLLEEVEAGGEAYC